jgi:hypothetical protein
MMARRERTRHLIELGGLVLKAGLVELSGDDRQLLYGGFLDLAGRLRGEDGEHAKALFKRRGARAFADESRQSDPVGNGSGR